MPQPDSSDLAASLAAFLACRRFAVVGASNDPAKFGGRVLAAYRRHGRVAFAVNPRERLLQGEPCYPSLAALPERVEAISIVTPPAVTERIVDEAADAGVRFAWMQPGAESAKAIATAKARGLVVIAGGPCLLIEIEQR